MVRRRESGGRGGQFGVGQADALSMMKTSAPELSFMAARSRPPLPRMRLQEAREVVEKVQAEVGGGADGGGGEVEEVMQLTRYSASQ